MECQFDPLFHSSQLLYPLAGHFRASGGVNELASLTGLNKVSCKFKHFTILQNLKAVYVNATFLNENVCFDTLLFFVNLRSFCSYLEVVVIPDSLVDGSFWDQNR